MKTLFFFMLGCTFALAQTNPVTTRPLSPGDQAEIQSKARKKLDDFMGILNALTFEDLSAQERDTIIKRSYVANQNQVFLDENVLIQDDTDPAFTKYEGSALLSVRAYFLKLDTLYEKTPDSKITFNNIRTLLVQGTSGIYVKIFYTSTFDSRQTGTKKAYSSTSRVAQVQIKRNGTQWEGFISRLSFENPGEGMEISSDLSPKDREELKEIAVNKIEINLNNLLDTLTRLGVSDFRQDEVIKKSFLPNPRQIFLDDGVIIEDDIDPNHTDQRTVVDTPVETYLRNLSLFYTKMTKPSIRLSNVKIIKFTDAEKPRIQVGFTSTFTGKHRQIDKSYVPTKRIADLQAERTGRRWVVTVTRLAFDTSEPPKRGSISEEQQKKRARYRRQGWLLLLGGVAGLAGGYLTYTKLQTDHKAYLSRVNALNTEYDQWRVLSAEPAGSRMTPLDFAQYANPSHYVTYGIGAGGLVLTMTGIGRLLKAARMGKTK